jgi:hypothetical protein
MRIIRDIAESQIVPTIIAGDFNPPITPSAQQAKTNKESTPEINFKAEFMKRIFKGAFSPTKTPSKRKSSDKSFKTASPVLNQDSPSATKDSPDSPLLGRSISPHHAKATFSESPTSHLDTSVNLKTTVSDSFITDQDNNANPQTSNAAAASSSNSPIASSSNPKIAKIKSILFPNENNIFTDYNIIKSNDKDYDYMVFKNVSYKTSLTADALPPYPKAKAAREINEASFQIPKGDFPSDHLPFLGTFELTHDQTQNAFKDKTIPYLKYLDGQDLNNNQTWNHFFKRLHNEKAILFSFPTEITETLKRLYNDIFQELYVSPQKHTRSALTSQPQTPQARALTLTYQNNDDDDALTL